MMGQFEQLDQMLTEQEGMLRTSQVVSSGISKPVFYDYVRSRDLDRRPDVRALAQEQYEMRFPPRHLEDDEFNFFDEESFIE